MKNQKVTASKYTTGELFCGAGGLSRGFKALGCTPSFANDIWPVALHTFMMNFDPLYAETNGDRSRILALPQSVEDISIDEILENARSNSDAPLTPGALDILLGGPPCQGYSLNSHIRSAEDPRNFLFRHYVRLLRGLSPKVFVLENVPGMFSLEGGRFFDELIAKISKPTAACVGYDIDFKILNAAHYGVPQDRFRVVVIGTRRDVSAQVGKATVPTPRHYSLAQAHFKGGRDHTFHYAIGYRKRLERCDFDQTDPALLPPISVREAIGDLPPLTNGGGQDRTVYSAAQSPASHFQKKMRLKADVLTNHWCRALAHPNTERIKHIPAGGDWRSIPKELLPPGMRRAKRKDHTKRYGRLLPDEISGTLLTKPDPHWGTFIHYDENQQRLISVREAARIQSFPDCHVFFGGQVDQYKLCGNAVPPMMAQAIAEKVSQVLDLYYSTTETFNSNSTLELDRA
ncbi:DNA cytosine methyltransferase [Leisingera sp. NJS204]|uniref:DNA cytosine methyltransferase n=1 Tax=Leisingera sp. NJS204 TaxID=2508307 RepID=UPI0010139E72|nr:DNA cytosine methyltransferase [Leisingera sp. NJS204]QAX28136.1 DNA cytosine methyltransferase [Leisingera sp. NJS204]